MRLHTLTIEAVGPFAGTETVDFEQLTAGGLFLLEGPTGAGKTSVLDAITFALYGAPSAREVGAAMERMHSDFADPRTTPRVTCEFSVRGTTYRITRVPEHERPKLRGTGVTRERSSVHLERRDGESWVSVTSSQSEAADVVQAALGLTRDQFTQVVLLPQGEFARFLRADDDERRPLLTKLFGAGLFDRITADVDRRRRECDLRLAEATASVATALAAAAEAAGLDEDGRADLLALGQAERDAALAELARRLDADATAQALAAESAESDAAVAGADLGAVAERLERVQRLAAARDALRAHRADEAEHRARALSAAQARRAQPVRPLLQAMDRAEAAEAAARDALTTAVPTPGSDDPALLRAAADAADERAAGAGRLAAGLGHLAAVEATLPGEVAALAGDRAEAEAVATDLAALEQAASRAPTEAAAREADLAAARAAADRVEPLRAAVEGARRRSDAAAAIADAAAEVHRREEDLRTAVDTHQAAVDAHQDLTERRLAGMGAELAAALSTGEPCPVCGSPDHPRPARGDASTVSADDVAGAERDRSTAEEARRAAERRLADARASLAALEAVSGGVDPEAARAEVTRLTRELDETTQRAARSEELLAAVATARSATAAAEAAVVEARGRATRLEERITTREAALVLTRARVDEARDGHPTVAARVQALEEAATRETATATWLRRRADLVEARSAAQAEAVARGFADAESAAAALLPDDELAALDDAVEHWATELARLEGAVAAAAATLAPEDDGVLAGPSGPVDDGETDDDADLVEWAARLQRRHEAAEAVLAEATAHARHARANADAAAGRRDRFAARRVDVDRAVATHDHERAAAQPVLRMAGLLKGTDGARRMALSTYVLRYWFQRVVDAANVRLAQVSSSRYELVRTDEDGGRRDRGGLTLRVLDRHTGEERSPRSLSGGETFYTSLALALGLADVVRAEAGGADLDTLFIDEGFGTLDPETLEQVMTVIDDLRDRGRVVGIVSHVADLKDRITERLEVRRVTADGSSTLRVVA